uniref:Uncharacterized protein n=1 Tax=Rhizophora mucronata TaxID=61149 RepID=A0A2P2NJ89_RHIMU
MYTMEKRKETKKIKKDQVLVVQLDSLVPSWTMVTVLLVVNSSNRKEVVVNQLSTYPPIPSLPHPWKVLCVHQFEGTKMQSSILVPALACPPHCQFFCLPASLGAPQTILYRSIHNHHQ